MGPDRGDDPREFFFSLTGTGVASASSVRLCRTPTTGPVYPDGYLVVEVPVDEEPERPAFAFFAWRFSFSDLLAAVFELFEPPLSLLAMVASSRRERSER